MPINSHITNLNRAITASQTPVQRTAPGLSRVAIEAFQEAYKEDTGDLLSYPEAAEKARAIMTLMMIVSRPMQRDAYLLFLERMDELLPGHHAPRIPFDTEKSTS